MARYICKCGRVVNKSTNADNTGNRNTDGCEGCPYLLPWGPLAYKPGDGYVMDVKGKECRMSPSIDYTSTYYGSADDKCILRIVSLDLDFLEEMQVWINEHAEGQLSGGFSRDTIRGTDYSQAGRYCWSISCSQNKKGMAAKAALIQRFFDSGHRRLDMTPEEEKSYILAAIEAGKAAHQRKKDNMRYTISENLENDCVYAYAANEFWVYDKQACRWYTSGFCREQYEQAKLQCPSLTPEDFLEEDNDYNLLDDYELPRAALDALLEAVKGGKREAAPFEGEVPACSCAGCKREDCTCAGGRDATGRADCTGEQNCAQSGCTYTAKHPINPTQAAPASPADAGAATQSLSAADPVSLAADPAPKFDFSALGDLAEQAAEADEQFNLHYGRAQDEYLIACIYMARVHELTAKSGRYGGGTWTAWYQSKGISEGSARTMVQNGDGFKSATAADLKNLPEISKKDLNLIARQGAAEQVLEAAKENDSERVQEILAQLKAAKEAQAKAEQQLADAQHAHQAERESTSALLREEQQRRQQAEQGRIAAEKDKAAARRRADLAEKERDGARQALQGTKKLQEKWREKAESAQAQLDQLQAQPIPSTAIDLDEVERRVSQRLEEERAKQSPEDQERAQQDSRDAYDAFILAARSIDNIWKTLRPQVGRLGALQGNAKNMLLQQLMTVKEELIHECENCQSGS